MIKKILSNISSNSVVVTTKSICNLIINTYNGLYPFKLKTIEEFKSDVLTEIKDYNYLKYSLDNNSTYEMSKIYLDSSNLLVSKTNNKRLDDLYEIKKKYLFDEAINNEAINYYTNKNIVFIDYYKDDDYINFIISNLNCNYIYLYLKDAKSSYTVNYTNYDSYYDEIFDVVNRINEILNTSDNNIVINKVQDDYMIVLKEALKLYNISYNYKSTNSIYSVKFVKDLLDDVFSNLIDSSEFILEYNKKIETLSLNNITSKYIKTLSSRLSCFNYIDLSNVSVERLKELVVEYVKKITIDTKEKSIARVKIENIFNNYYDDNTIKFILNFNQDVVPKTFKDDGYISDEDIKILNKISNYTLLNSTNRNVIIKTKYLDYIRSNSNIYISSSKRINTTEAVKSSLLSSLADVLDEKTYKRDVSKINNEKFLMLNYRKELDSYNLYRSKTLTLDILNYLVKDKLNLSLDSFDSSFKGIYPIDRKIKLSFTSLDCFLSCGFKYYLKYILKIKKEEFEANTNFNTKTGTLLHYCLEKATDKLTIEEIDALILECINKEGFTLSSKEKLYLKKFVLEFKERLDIILDFEKRSKYEVYKKEETIKQLINDNVCFEGKIDKIYKHNNSYVLVDYKSKDVALDIRAILCHCDLQLLFYVYLLLEQIKDCDIQGIYLQSILSKSRIEDAKTLSDYVKKTTKLEGYTNPKREEIEAFDIMYDSEDKIYSCKVVNKDLSFAKTFNNHTLTSSDFKNIHKFIEELILESSYKITSRQFDINPFYVKNRVNSCQFCEYNEICYFKKENIKEKEPLKTIEELRSKLGELYGEI